MASKNEFGFLKGIFCNAILNNKKHVIILVSIFFFTILSCVFEEKANAFIAELGKQSEAKSGNEDIKSCALVKNYIIFYISHCLFGLLHNYIFYSNSTQIKSSVYKYLMQIYFRISSENSDTIKSSKAPSYLIKQSKATISLLSHFLINFTYSFFYLSLFFWSLFFGKEKNCTIQLKLTILLVFCFLICYLLFSISLTNPIMRKLIKSGHHSNVLLYEIFGNLDIVRSYKSEDLEITKFQRSLDSEGFFTNLYHKLDQFFTLFFRMMNVIIALSIILKNNYSKVFLERTEFIIAANVFTLYFKFKILKTHINKIRDSLIKMKDDIADISTSEFVICEEIKRTVELQTSFLDIQFWDVSVSQNSIQIFSNLNLSIKQGEKIAVTGRNGSGKSTIMKCLLRFQNYKGDIIFNDVNLKEITESSLRKLVSYVPQDSSLFNMSIMDNLRYGKEISDDKVIEMCVQYGLDEFFSKTSNGYSTIVGVHHKNISGGQAQMINFMRAVISDPLIYILDEPTSNLDYYSSSMLVNVILNSLGNKTVFFSTHNPDHLKKFDKIINISDKSVHIYNSYDEFEAQMKFSVDI